MEMPINLRDWLIDRHIIQIEKENERRQAEERAARARAK